MMLHMILEPDVFVKEFRKTKVVIYCWPEVSGSIAGVDSIMMLPLACL